MPDRKYQLLKDLLPWLEKYEQEKGANDFTIPDFQVWLGQQLNQEKQVFPPATSDDLLDEEISRYLTNLNRYAKFYIKKALLATDFVSLDDFGYLMHLLDGGPLTKSGLILKNIHDIPSGTEIIKRLIRQEWVNETRDETDKRKIYLSINEKGKAALFASLGQLRKVSKIVSADLTASEKEQLLLILKKLNDYHHQTYFKTKDKPLDDLVK
jgi:MarR family transcriptional regulator, lower aerobic nicotinate degradation pathway regulator